MRREWNKMTERIEQKESNERTERTERTFRIERIKMNMSEGDGKKYFALGFEVESRARSKVKK